LGLVGLVLFATAIFGLFAAAVRNLWRRRSHAEGPLLAACFAAALAFAAHMSVDWDWDMAAATIAFLLLLTVVAVFSPAKATATEGGPAQAEADATDPAPLDDDGADVGEQVGSEATAAPGRVPRRRRLTLPATILACGLPLLLAASWTFPYLSARAEARAVSEADQHPVAAAASARRALSLDPLGVGPLITLSQIQQGQGRPAAALSTLRRAERLQPGNYKVHYSLGLVLATALHRDAAAVNEFRLALALNPLDGLSQFALDQVARR
jgi:cytochrome c-type biogenesis protein CcmH/NrfG